MRIMSCNIRCACGGDGENNWQYRNDFCCEVIRKRDPDIIGFQEVWEEQFHDLLSRFGDYHWYAMVDEPVGRRPMNSIFYRAEAFGRISAGAYWLSETPHVAGSSSWDSECVRLANWIRLEDKASGKEFRVVNTHLDHVSQPARENQARLIAEDAAGYPEDYPQLLTGDMNSDRRNKAIAILKSGGWVDTYECVHGAGYPGHTAHAFTGPAFETDSGKIDWVFMRGDVRADDAQVIRDSKDGRFPSDHYFVSADVGL